MSLSSVCTNVLRETGFSVPSAFAASTDAQAQQLVAIANTELEFLSEEYDWPHLETEYTFDTVVDQNEYAMPSDFRKLVSDTLYDTTEYYRIKGSVDASTFMLLKHGNIGTLPKTRFRTIYDADGDPKISLVATPNTVRSLVMLYQRNTFARSAAGAAKTSYTADDDVSAVPENLIKLGVKWRFRRAKGLDYSAELAEYNARVQTQLAKYRNSGSIQVGGNEYLEDYGLTSGYVPENGFGV